jgi:hypothetical protein
VLTNKTACEVGLRALVQRTPELDDRDFLDQAVRHGRSHGLLSAEEHAVLMRELEPEGVGGRA